ncbi:MAG: phospholipase A [Campylobacterota bacterium]|nr:phospholipase A [Campylobacterota bacterium]
MIKYLLVISLFIGSAFATTDYEEAYRVYKAKEFEKSLEMFSKLVEEENDYDAAYILGYMYEHGEGCEIDIKKSQKYYKISSRGYYFHLKSDPTRNIDKEQKQLYDSLEKIEDIETDNTIRRYTQSLYNIKTHKPTYFLPISYRSNGSYGPTNGHNAKDIETEFQVSIKYDFAANLFDLNEVYTFAYTQLAFWQLYEESAYFRETNYNPEFFITFPLSEIIESSFLKVLRVSFAHQSNGRGGAEERSWNYLSAATYFQYKYLFTELKLWHRLPDTTDYNPELIDYMGHGHLRFTVPYKKHIAKLLLRSNFSGKNAVELNYSYPVFARDDLFLYVKGFSGYGESLIDYDNHVNKIGFGFSISR